ncbi:uncharacterized protein TRAVEDRAFT_85831, partial [Trametes versicolor FP-101664 SS1]|uniref:uncharacterized protein n=1 Tax=Trametes versicolor (strain FP-101664) TaxID=717944 RepID=UPI0004622299
LELETITRFFDMTCWLQAEIAAHQPSYVSSPPFLLPRNVHEFLLDALGINNRTAKTLWATLREEVWVEATEDSPDIEVRARRMLDMFLKHGPTYDIAFYNFRPPSRTCLDPKCAVELDMAPGQTRPKELDHPLSHSATLFTKDLGPLPVRSISLYCRSCHTRYHPDYYVHSSATMRTYYANVPRALQVATHYFVTAELCELFANMMTFA